MHIPSWVLIPYNKCPKRMPKKSENPIFMQLFSENFQH